MKVRALGLSVAATTVLIGLGMSQAQGAAVVGNGPPAGTYTTSEVSVGSSSVAGSSPTSLGNSPLSKTAAGRAAARGTSAEDEAAGEVTSSARAVLYDPKSGAVLARHRYGATTEGERLRAPKPPLSSNGTGGSTSASGCIRVFVTQKLHSFSGLSVLGKWQIWTDWCWTRSNQVVAVNDKGVSQEHDQFWSYDGVKTEFNENHYYDFSADNGYPRSAYLFVRVAAFSGPAITGHDAQWTPKNSLASYYNGTWQWWTSS